MQRGKVEKVETQVEQWLAEVLQLLEDLPARRREATLREMKLLAQHRAQCGDKTGSDRLFEYIG